MHSMPESASATLDFALCIIKHGLKTQKIETIGIYEYK